LHLPERLSLNISALQLVDPDFEGRLETLRRRHAVDARHIELELTESSLIADPEAAIALFGRLVRAGYSLAIDDFGTGYSSLSYLKRLPVSRLDNPNDQAIVETVLAMARALGLGTVAEGTESEATSHALAALGCDAAQGYYYSAALSADAFADAWLKQVDPARMR
jgi:EAL domain-containing protein (putative c-di-GMP-specific phosphodiesterase class I)